MTPRLIVLNGPPAAGKSTLARRYAADHPLTLNLDVDRVRDLIGGWRDDPGAAGLLARSVAVAAARTHLLAGRDGAPGRPWADAGRREGVGEVDGGRVERVGEVDGGRVERVGEVVDPARLGGLPTLRAGTDNHGCSGPADAVSAAHADAASAAHDDPVSAGHADPACAGHDVVVAQLVARPGFLERLEAVAEEAGATFHELVLMDEKAAVLRRFADRARTAADALGADPGEPAALYDRLTAFLVRRPRAVVVPVVEGAIDETYRRVIAQLGTGE